MPSSSQQGNRQRALRPEMIGLFWYLLGVACVLPFTLLGTSLAEQNPNCGDICGFAVVIFLSFFSFLIHSCTYVYGRHFPRLPIGRHAKLAAYLITLSAAILLRFWLEYSWKYLVFLVLCFLEVLVSLKLLCGATDINFCDALMGALMQVAAYVTWSEPYFIAVLVLFGPIIFCRYWFYSAPETSFSIKDDLEMVPCLVVHQNNENL